MCDGVDVGRGDFGVALCAGFAVAEVVGEEKDDVGAIGCGVLGAEGCCTAENAKGAEDKEQMDERGCGFWCVHGDMITDWMGRLVRKGGVAVNQEG